MDTRAECGFTLVETLVALTITAALLSVVYSGLWVGAGATRQVTGTIAGNESLRTLDYFLRNQLRQLDTGTTGDSTPLRGERDAMRFRVRHLRGDPSSRTLALKLSGGPGPGMALGVSLVDGPSDDLPVDTVLLQDLSSLAIAYYGADNETAAAAWRAVWHNEKRLPRMVRIRYRQHGGPGREIHFTVAGGGDNLLNGRQ